jgi:fibronectin-binding autotransporter adhesin
VTLSPQPSTSDCSQEGRGGRRSRTARRAIRVGCLVLAVSVGSALSGGGVATASASCGTTFVSANGSWATAANWSEGTVPASSDDVCIPAGRTAQVNTTHVVESVQGEGALTVYSGGSLSLTSISSIGTLSVTGGTLTGAGDINVATGFSWSGGTMSGSGTTTVAVSASGSIRGGTLARRLVNRGSLTASDHSWLGTSAAVLENEGTFTHNVPHSYGYGINVASSGATPQIRNSGLFRKTVHGTGLSWVGWQFENAGEVQVQTGDLYFVGGGIAGSSASGSWTGAGTARLASGTLTWTAGVQISGTVLVAGATVDGEDVHGSGTLSLNSGSLSLSQPSSIGTLSMTGEGLTGAGDLSVTSGLSWYGGTMSGTGTTTVTSSVSGSITGGTLARKLINRGSLTAAGNWLGTSAAWLENEGTFTNNIPPSYGWGMNVASTGATPSVRNTGMFRKTQGAGLSWVGWRFENAGEVQVQTGDLYFGGGAIPGSSASGSWTGAGSARLTAGTFTWTAGVQISSTVVVAGATVNAEDVHGDGTLSLLTSGTLSVSQTSAIRTLSLGGGTLTGGGDLSVAAGFSWAGGTMSGTGRTTLSAGVTTGSITGGTLARTLTNRGFVTASGGWWKGTSEAVLENDGTFVQDIPYTADNGLNVSTQGATPRSATPGCSGRRTPTHSASSIGSSTTAAPSRRPMEASTSAADRSRARC